MVNKVSARYNTELARAIDVMMVPGKKIQSRFLDLRENKIMLIKEYKKVFDQVWKSFHWGSQYALLLYYCYGFYGNEASIAISSITTRGKIVFDHVDITWFGPFCHPSNQVIQPLSPPQRLKGRVFSGGEDPLSNVRAGTW